MKNLILTLCVLVVISCKEEIQYYSLEDFDKVDKIDVHIHVETNRNIFVEQARKDNFRLLNIVVDISEGQENIEKRYEYCLDQKTRHPKDFEFATAFSIENWDDPDWLKTTLDWLDKSFEEGAIAVKVWKNIGMVFRDKNGELVMIDDPKLDTIFKYLTKRKIPLIGHLGEPKNCWLPLDEMTVSNDRIYFENNPQYHMYKHPELPSYEDQIAARDRMLEKNPELIFIGAHVGSLEWSVDELAKRLDKFPNMTVDLAARIGQIMYQTIADRKKVRNFFIEYQDRMLYATDLYDEDIYDVAEIQDKMHSTWLEDWQFLVTDDVMTSDLLSKEFKGLKLPKEVVDKIYEKNARRWLKMFPDEMK